MDASGNFVVAYEVQTGPVKEVLYAQRFNAAGASQGKAINLNTTNLANDQATVAMDSNGNFVVTWYGAFQRVDRLGAKQGSVVTLPGAGRTTVGMDATGHFVVAWQTGTSPVTMQARMYNADGTARAPVFPVDSASPYGYPVVAMAPDGAFSISWTGGLGPYEDVYVKGFTAAGLGSPTLVANLTTNYTGVGPPAAAMANGHLLVAWNEPGPGDDAGVFGQLYTYSPTAALQAIVGGAANPSSATVLPKALLQPLVEQGASISTGDSLSRPTGLIPDDSTWLGDLTLAVGGRERLDLIDTLFSLSPAALWA
jgi:hypothetical protein